MYELMIFQDEEQYRDENAPGVLIEFEELRDLSDTVFPLLKTDAVCLVRKKE